MVGYSFGDVYMNHVIERMELIHGDSKRIVLIDWWPLHVDEKIVGITDSEQMGCIKSMMQQRVRDTDFNKELGYFLCRMTGKTQFDEAVTCFKNYDRIGPMVSLNGCLMLFIGGFKAAVGYKDKIYDFLNS